MMDEDESERLSVLMSTFLDRYGGVSREVVDIRRSSSLVQEYIENGGDTDCDTFYGGSKGEGLRMPGSDVDMMYIDKLTTAVYPGQHSHPRRINNTIFYMRKGQGCRPGYVTLQLGHLGTGYDWELCESLVLVDGELFVSSDIYREQYINFMGKTVGVKCGSSGPSGTSNVTGISTDSVFCFALDSWPRDASEWTTRTRLYGWPSQTLIETIVQSDCHVVPVGDKCSENTSLQWRISFATAERRLIHSLSHIQFQVYYLLKYFLKQIKQDLKEIIGDEDILCSYFLKTVMFFAVEQSHQLFWQEKNLFYCFWFCFNILITWVKAGYCPNYFILANNLFQRKVNGKNQQILFHMLNEYHQMKSMCLSVGPYQPSVIDNVCGAEMQVELQHPQRMEEIEYIKDMELAPCMWLQTAYQPNVIRQGLTLLRESQSDVEEVMTYYGTVRALLKDANKIYQDHMIAADNKTRYRSMRKCKHWTMIMASLGTDLLYLTTFHFLVGNYSKSLEMCRHILSQESYYLYMVTGNLPPAKKDNYIHYYCGKGHTSIHKLQKTFTSDLVFTPKDWCLPHLELEVSKFLGCSVIPPLPYAVFMSFVCYNELGDIKGRDAALRNMISFKDDREQGGHTHWIVHTLLGICYQTLGDNREAIRAYIDSHQTKTPFHQYNPAMDRIAVVYLVMCYLSLRSTRHRDHKAV